MKKKYANPLIILVVSLVLLSIQGYFFFTVSSENTKLNNDIGTLTARKTELEQQIASVSAELEVLKNVDQKIRNDDLEKELKHIKSTYNSAVKSYEALVKLKEVSKDTDGFDDAYTESLIYLTEQNWASASAELKQLEKNIAVERSEIASKFVIPASVPQSNDPPGSGYSRQSVSTEIGTYLVSMHAADLGSARAVVDTASDGTCGNDCPVLSLADYVSRNGAFAGVNGSYFCPASYPSCAGKTNSFDTLAMNKNKVYFNSDNNVYSTIPVVIFGDGWVRFEGQSLNWGRDTGVDGVLANQPMLVGGGNVLFGGDGDPKKGSKAGRSFVANKSNTVYIGVVHSSTVAEAAIVLKTLGMENALNLDSGGSTAFWSGGYKVGPGRSIPNAILFVRK